MLIQRQAGDNYPINAILSINKVPIDLTDSEVVFSFKLKDSDSAVTPIIGVLGTDLGSVSFTPTEEQMSVAGTYIYDIQRKYDGVVATHTNGIMILNDDVSY